MIIGFVGLMGSGKDEAARYLDEEHGFLVESFANSVKDGLSAIFGWSRDLLEGTDNFSREWRETPQAFWSHAFGYDFTPRKAMQLLGTESGRKIIHPDIWIHTTFRRMIPGLNYVISDVRFPNEIREIRDRGGKIVRIRRGEDPDWLKKVQMLGYDDEGLESFMRVKHPEIHESEWAWANCKFDHIINNDYGIKELQSSIEDLLLLQAA